MLSRVRVGDQTDEDVEALKGLEDNEEIPRGSLSIFLTNELKDNYNKEQLALLTSEVVHIKAEDSKKDIHTKRVTVNVTSTNPHETGGLAADVQVALNARFMLTKNIDTEDGLVNGATGTIIKLEIPHSKPLLGALYIKFDDPKIGKQAKTASRHKGLVPIRAVTAPFSISERASSILVERKQFPGTLAWGITVHKAQGSTFEQMIGDMTLSEKKSNTMPGQIYTMLSRAKEMKGLKLKSFQADKIKVNSSALQEMKRLQSMVKDLATLNISEDSKAIGFLNIRSLKEHYQDLCQNDLSEKLDFLCLSETKVKDYSRYQLEGMTCVCSRTPHGSAVFTKYHDVQHFQIMIKKTEVLVVLADDTLVASMYVPPNIPWSELSIELRGIAQQLNDLSNEHQALHTVLGGDFNADYQRLAAISKLMLEYGLQQLVQTPTHERGAILDVIFSSLPEYCTVLNIPLWFTDHHAVVIQQQNFDL